MVPGRGDEMNNWRCSDVCLSPLAVLSDLLNFSTNTREHDREADKDHPPSQQTLLALLCWNNSAIFFVFPAAEADFVSGVLSHLCDTANQKKQHYGELDLTPYSKNPLTQILYFFLCHNFRSVTLPVTIGLVCVFTNLLKPKRRDGATPELPQPPNPILSHYWNNTEDGANLHKWHPSIIHSIKITVPLVVALFCYPDLVFYIGNLPVLLIHVCFCAVSHRELLRGGGTHCS